MGGRGKNSGAQRKLIAHGAGKPGDRSPKITVLCVLAVVIAAIVAYVNSLDGALFFDNRSIILENPLVTGEEAMVKILDTDYWLAALPSNLYRPLTIFTYYVNYSLLGGGKNPAGYHVFNLILHAVNGALVFAFVLALARRRLAALFAALLFVTHPVATEAVTNVVGRADLLAMMFALGALLLHMKGAVRKNPVVFHLGAAALLALGMLSKENAITMIGLALALDALVLWPRSGGATGFLRWFGPHALRSYTLYAAVVAAWFVVRSLVIPANGVYLGFGWEQPYETAPLLQREMTAVSVLGLYYLRLAFPLMLSADYSYNQIPLITSPANVGFLAGLALTLAAFAAAFFLRRKIRPAAFLILFFFIALAPVSNVFSAIGAVAAERFLYMPLLAWSALAAMGVFALSEKLLKPEKRSIAAACAALALITGLYAARTIVRNEDWRTEPAFWRATYAASPNSAMVVMEYANLLMREGRDDEAIDALQRAIRVAPEDLRIDSTLGSVYMKRGDESRERNHWHRMAYEAFLRAEDIYDKMRLDARRRLAERGLERLEYDVLATWWDLPALLSDACMRMAETHRNEGDLDKADEMLNLAVHYSKEAILRAIHAPQAALHAKMTIALMELSRRAQERDALLDEAAVSAARAFVLQPEDVFWKKMTADNDKLRQDPEGYKKRALKSLIKLSLARGKEDLARAWADVAYRGYRVPRSEIEPLFREHYTTDDPQIWK